ncbi:FAD:protein FMN transferase [Tabrizicola sp. J26]|uniref:FAD:protein FMN transferase n=1 Tax=Alitabrizicola rongguiensis TaxID=2909234 RepID=UPI001F3590F9|nr:FAD:protein FMN transferase [Tabrizicola rongguiensis]MCF1708894.1 FAD:protein FMN transferase [Tabrizicola rongguiensis]
MPKTSTDDAIVFGGPTMGTRWSVLIDEGAVDIDLGAHLQAAVDEVDAQMSTWKPDSDLMRLNAAQLDSWVPLPQELLTVLSAGLAVSRQTGGAFEMNIVDAVRAWGFGPDRIDLGAIRAASATPRVPATEALELDIANRRARKSAALALDLSGIAKGYGVDRLTETATALGYTSTLCSIDGEVRATGLRRTGRPWAVGVETPDDQATAPHSILALEDMAVATSGDYRHYVSVGTTRLSHTMDPRRGAPLVAAPASVTVMSQHCMLADAMATALMVMGDSQGLDFATDHAISALFLRRSKGGMITSVTGTFATSYERGRG